MASGLRVSLGMFTLAWSLSCGANVARAESDDGQRLFTLKVGPLLSQRCAGCHGEDVTKVKGGFRVLSRDDLLRGGDTHADVLRPGRPEQSFLLTAVRWEDPDCEMPPKENDRLSEEEIEALEEWISLGAPWPGEERQREIREAERARMVTEEGMLVLTSGGQSDDWTYRRYREDEVWAFLPVKRPELPDGSTEGMVHPVDAFIDRKLADAGLEAAPAGDPLTLLRRASFDLTGLPPTPEETERFLRDHREDGQRAWDALLDRLLASPHYGERSAQHWLDVTRYADTGGMANDFERSNMWRYRDYVVRSFNEDKPYDRFVLEQIAGDEMAEASARARLGGDEAALEAVRRLGNFTEAEADMMVGTGFLRMGPWDNAMITDEEARQIYLDDVVHAVGQTFLSVPLRCAKCHDHKFDPIPTRDYYRMMAAFAGTQMAERPLRFLSVENREGMEEDRVIVERLRDFAAGEAAQLVAEREAAAREWYAERGLPYKDAEARKDDPDDTKPPRNVGMDHEAEGKLKVREQDEWIWTRRLERYEPMIQSVYNGPDMRLAWNGARKLRMPEQIDASARPTSFIYLGGALTAKGERVDPGVLSALSLATEAEVSDPYILSEDLRGRRLGLARWIARPDNPLTTRSIVNRLWQQHFGHGLAGNPNHFGVKGSKPSHPQLLDYLAADFVEHGWAIKRMHKLIMTSKVYQRRSVSLEPEKAAVADPDNQLLSSFPPRRLSAEELRDSLLLSTGELNREQGGLPVRPEINLEVALQPRMIQFSLAPAYQPSPRPKDRNRRSLYAYRVRGMADPFLEVFNQPHPNDSCEGRSQASVSPQAFTLFNSDLLTDRSIALAIRLEKETTELNEQIGRAFQLTLGRLPGEEERSRLRAYVEDMRAYHAEVTPPPVSYPTEVTRSLVEEFSGKTFAYREILPAFAGYQRDAKAADVGPDTRALADLCLLLFNTHAFVYLY